MPGIVEWGSVNSLFTATNHCNFGNGSTTAPDRCAVATFCIVFSSSSNKLCSRSQATISSRASATFLPASCPATLIFAYSLITGLIGKVCLCAISQSIMLCAGVTPSAPVPNSGSTLSSATTVTSTGTSTNVNENVRPMYCL